MLISGGFFATRVVANDGLVDIKGGFWTHYEATLGEQVTLPLVMIFQVDSAGVSSGRINITWRGPDMAMMPDQFSEDIVLAAEGPGQSGLVAPLEVIFRQHGLHTVFVHLVDAGAPLSIPLDVRPVG